MFSCSLSACTSGSESVTFPQASLAMSESHVTRSLVFTSASLLSTCSVINKDLPFIVPLHLALWFACQKLLKLTLEAHRAPAGGHVRITSTWFSGHIGNLQYETQQMQNECMSLETLFVWQQVSLCHCLVSFLFLQVITGYVLDLWTSRGTNCYTVSITP